MFEADKCGAIYANSGEYGKARKARIILIGFPVLGIINTSVFTQKSQNREWQKKAQGDRNYHRHSKFLAREQFALFADARNWRKVQKSARALQRHVFAGKYEAKERRERRQGVFRSNAIVTLEKAPRVRFPQPGSEASRRRAVRKPE